MLKPDSVDGFYSIKHASCPFELEELEESDSNFSRNYLTKRKRVSFTNSQVRILNEDILDKFGEEIDVLYSRSKIKDKTKTKLAKTNTNTNTKGLNFITTNTQEMADIKNYLTELETKGFKNFTQAFKKYQPSQKSHNSFLNYFTCQSENDLMKGQCTWYKIRKSLNWSLRVLYSILAFEMNIGSHIGECCCFFSQVWLVEREFL